MSAAAVSEDQRLCLGLNHQSVSRHGQGLGQHLERTVSGFDEVGGGYVVAHQQADPLVLLVEQHLGSAGVPTHPSREASTTLAVCTAPCTNPNFLPSTPSHQVLSACMAAPTPLANRLA